MIGYLCDEKPVTACVSKNGEEAVSKYLVARLNAFTKITCRSILNHDAILYFMNV